MERQCLSKVWKTEKKQIRQGTSKRNETDWEWRGKKRKPPLFSLKALLVGFAGNAHAGERSAVKLSLGVPHPLNTYFLLHRCSCFDEAQSLPKTSLISERIAYYRRHVCCFYQNLRYLPRTCICSSGSAACSCPIQTPPWYEVLHFKIDCVWEQDKCSTRRPGRPAPSHVLWGRGLPSARC